MRQHGRLGVVGFFNQILISLQLVGHTCKNNVYHFHLFFSTTFCCDRCEQRVAICRVCLYADFYNHFRAVFLESAYMQRYTIRAKNSLMYYGEIALSALHLVESDTTVKL